MKTVLLLSLYILPLPHRSCLLLSLRKHPCLHVPRRCGRFARRKVCDSAAEIPFWWRKICPESGQKPWLVYGVVTLFYLLFTNDKSLIRDPRSSLTETKSSRKESNFPAEMPLIKSVGAANLQSPVKPRKFVALYHRNTKIRMGSDERDYCRTSLITAPDVLICQLENCLGECKMKPKGYWSRLYTVISISSMSHTRFVFKLSVSLFNVTFRCWYCCWLVYIWKTGCYGFLGQDSKTLGCWNSRTSSSINW